MRRLGRIFRRILTGLSVLLLLATLAVWAKGYWQGATLMLFSEKVDPEGWVMRWWNFESCGGDVGVARVWFYADTAQARAHGRLPGTRREWGVYNRDTWSVGRSYAWYGRGVRRANTRPLYWDHAGIVFARLEGRGTRGGLWAGVVDDVWARIDRFAFPCWMPAVLFALLPGQRVYAFVRYRRQRRREKAGECPACGYDLRATPDAGGPLLARCPECGWGSARQCSAGVPVAVPPK